MDILSAATATYSIGKKLLEISAKLKDAEAKNLIADLQISLAELKIRIAELMEEKTGLNEQLRKFRTELDEAKFSPKPGTKPLSPAAKGRAAIVARDGMYYLKEPAEGYADGPYCTACMDRGGNLVLLQELGRAWKHFGTHECPVCRANFGGSGL
jgi:hypothetical protein